MIRLMHISIQFDDLHEQTTADFRRKTRTRGLWGVGVADCLWQSLCDLTESGDESRPLQIFGVKTRTVGLYDSSDAYLDTVR